MEQLLEQLAKAFISKADTATLSLVFVVVVEAYLLIKALNRVDLLVVELSKNSTTLDELTKLLNRLIYG